MVRGAGTALNMAAILVGSGLGVLLRGHLPERTRTTVTDALGLVTLFIGGLNVAALGDAGFRSAVGEGGTLLVVLGALLVGGIVGLDGFASLAFASSPHRHCVLDLEQVQACGSGRRGR